MAHPIYKHADGTRLPSVTTVIGRFKESGGLIHWAWNLGMEGKDYRKERDSAANAGTLAHDMIEAHIREWAMPDPGDDEAIFEKALKGYEGFKEWASYTKLEILGTEVSLVCDEYRFGGTVDAIGQANGKLCLLDWKTSNRIYHDYLIQVASYRWLWENGRLNATEGTDSWEPEHLGEAIEGLHLLRVGKEWGDFHHHYWPLGVLDLGWEQFKLLRRAHHNDKQLKRAV